MTLINIYIIHGNRTGTFLAYIFILVDPCDIILHCLKLLDLIINGDDKQKAPSKLLDSMRTILFLLLVTVWLYMRIYTLPKYFHSLSLRCWIETSNSYPFMLLFNIIHIILTLMNLYWTYSLFAVLFQFIVFYRSDDKSLINKSLSLRDPLTT